MGTRIPEGVTFTVGVSTATSTTEGNDACTKQEKSEMPISGTVTVCHGPAMPLPNYE